MCRKVERQKEGGEGQPEISGEKNASSVTLRAHLKRELLYISFSPFIFFSHEQSFHGRRPKGGRPRGKMATDIERNAGKKSGSETRRSVNNASTNSSGILVFVLGVLLGCFVVYVGSSSSSKKRVVIVPKHLKDVHNRFRASRDAWRNWGEDMDALQFCTARGGGRNFTERRKDQLQ